MKHNLGLAKEAAARDSANETAKKNAAALAKEFHQREIEVMLRRIDRYPQDLRLKFELARRYMREQSWSKAIPLLQQAGADSRQECEVLVALGECFLADGKRDLAIRQFDKALPKINPQEQTDLLKKAHYLAGRICEKTGKRDAAENHYSEVLVLDYDYQDARERLEKLQAGDDAAESA
jgi:tetratricopeptide (TPR) repeat protein